MEKKIHYKMHKVKKNWVAIGVTTLALIVAPKVLGLEAGLVHADDVKQVAVQEPAAAQDSGSGQPVQVQANSASQLEAEKATSADKVVDAAVASEKTAETAANTEAAAQTDAQEPAKPAVAEAATTEKAAVAEEAKAATSPSSPNIPKNGALATALGFILAVAGVILFELLDDRVKRAEDIEETMGLVLLGVVPDTKTGKR